MHLIHTPKRAILYTSTECGRLTVLRFHYSLFGLLLFVKEDLLGDSLTVYLRPDR